MLNEENPISVRNDQQIQQNHMTLSEIKIIRKATTDPASFTTLYRQYATRVYRYIYTRVNNHNEAEDLTAQVFMAVLQQLKSFGGNGNFNAWLFTIARNKVVDSYRKRQNVVSLDDVANFTGRDDPFNELVQNETFGQLQQALMALPLEQQELLQLRYAAGLSYGEIGMVVGKSEAAVKMSVHRLLRQLQDVMEKADEK